MDHHVIVNSRTLARHQKLGKLGAIGMVVGGLALLYAAFLLGEERAYRRTRAELQSLTERQTELQRALVSEWHQQTQAIQLIGDWVDYIKDREDVAVMSQKQSPIQRPWRKHP